MEDTKQIIKGDRQMFIVIRKYVSSFMSRNRKLVP